MSTDDTTGPSPEAIAAFITQTFAGVDVAGTGGGTFFSLDPETHWPNFATLVTTDEFDDASDLSRAGVFRLNIGLGRETFERLVGDQDEPDYTALDRLLRHPVYAAQHWVSILNPSPATFEAQVKPLLHEAYQRLAAQQARHGRA